MVHNKYAYIINYARIPSSSQDYASILFHFKGSTQSLVNFITLAHAAVGGTILIVILIIFCIAIFLLRCFCRKKKSKGHQFTTIPNPDITIHQKINTQNATKSESALELLPVDDYYNLNCNWLPVCLESDVSATHGPANGPTTNFDCNQSNHLKIIKDAPNDDTENAIGLETDNQLYDMVLSITAAHNETTIDSGVINRSYDSNSKVTNNATEYQYDYVQTDKCFLIDTKCNPSCSSKLKNNDVEDQYDYAAVDQYFRYHPSKGTKVPLSNNYIATNCNSRVEMTYNPSYDLPSALPKLEDNPSYKKITFSQHL